MPSAHVQLSSSTKSKYGPKSDDQFVPDDSHFSPSHDQTKTKQTLKKPKTKQKTHPFFMSAADLPNPDF
jgi:hypothetical protein